MLFSVLIATSTRFHVLWTGLAVSVALVVLARLPVTPLLKRLLTVNGFMLFLWAFLPFSYAGSEAFRIGRLAASYEGLQYCAEITLKANAIVLCCIALIATSDLVHIGHALVHLHVPVKLSQILLFSIRYFSVLHREYTRLRNAMKLRGFRPGTNLHSYRAFGNLVGMLLVRSFDRTERVLAAMKCRGFRGQFRVLDHFHWHRRDTVFMLAGLPILAVLGVIQWLPTAI